jgi:4'-phosphopantetheinyl transferase EntD
VAKPNSSQALSRDNDSPIDAVIPGRCVIKRMMPEPPATPSPTLGRLASAFDGLLAGGSVVAEVRAPHFHVSGLWPEEETLIAGAVEKRRREFAAGRTCARLALQRLGMSPAAIGAGSHREPLFPAGISGSITHTREYCAAAVVRTGPVLSIGIDAEFNEPLENSVADLILSPDERRMAHAFGNICSGDALVFSIKEAFFKAVFPFCRQYLDFADVVVALSPTDRTFRADLVKTDMMARLGDAVVVGRYEFDSRHLYTAVSLLSPRARA